MFTNSIVLTITTCVVCVCCVRLSSKLSLISFVKSREAVDPDHQFGKWSCFSVCLSMDAWR